MRTFRLAHVAVGAAVLVAASTGASPVAARGGGETIRWYGVDPHVPLAIVRRDAGAADAPWVIDTITGNVAPEAARKAAASARLRACRTWARLGSSWIGVDRWGQVVGARKIRGRHLNPVTGCTEVTFPDDATTERAPASSIVLYESGAWRAPPSSEWRPSAAIRREHEAFIAELTSRVVSPSSACRPKVPLERRTMFFQARGSQFAVSGGCALVVAERAAAGRWFAAYVNAELANEAVTGDLPYEPSAVFDMNDDGWPEIVAGEREQGWEFYGDVVISRDENGVWALAARSAGGAD